MVKIYQEILISILNLKKPQLIILFITLLKLKKNCVELDFSMIKKVKFGMI